MNRCTAHNRRGEQCGRAAAPGKNVCYMHGGAPGSGAPRGNRNALKHGYYSRLLSIEERHALDRAMQLAVDDLDHEIALLRVKIMRAAAAAPDNLSVIARGVDALARAMSARRRLSDGHDQLDEALGKALTELSEELGIPL